MIPAATSLIAGIKSARTFLTLAVVLVAAATLYVWWQGAETARLKALAERNDLWSRAVNICEAAGLPFSPTGTQRPDAGVACLQTVRELRAFRRETVTGSLDVALAAIERQRGKEAADAALALAYGQRASEALSRMEAADAAVEDDRVGGGWAAAVNELGGLRD